MDRWRTVGKAVAARMDELGLTKAELIRRSGVSQKTLDAYLDGQPIVRVDKKRGLCEALRWMPNSIDRLLAGEDPVSISAEPSLSELELTERVKALEEQNARIRAALAQVIETFSSLGVENPLPSMRWFGDESPGERPVE